MFRSFRTFRPLSSRSIHRALSDKSDHYTLNLVPCAALLQSAMLRGGCICSRPVSNYCERRRIFSVSVTAAQRVFSAAYYCITISIFEYFGWRPGINLGAILIAPSGKTTRSVTAFITALPRALARISDSE